MRRFLAIVVVLFILISCGANSGATTIFSNLGAEEYSGEFNGAGCAIKESLTQGFQFPVFGDFLLGDLTVAIGNLSPMYYGSLGQYTFFVDLISGLPGSGLVVETYEFTVPGQEDRGYYPTLLSASPSGGHSSITSGEYWLVGRINYPDDGFVSWLMPVTNQEQAPRWISMGELSMIDMHPRTAFALESYCVTTPVPEPATIILLGSGLIGLLSIRRRSGSRC